MLQKSIFPQIIALYLPQFHPTPENDGWYGKGYTEWTNVAKARPLFKGHEQPKVPADLGFYDLRYPEIKEEQAKLAQEAGVTAFCYYHYWFGNGKQLLQTPLEQVVSTGKPEFPFCICWANHSWYKKLFNPDTSKIDNTLIMEQTYPGEEDIIAHFNYLLPAFKDKRYVKVDNRLLFVIYEVHHMPDFQQMKAIWNRLAKENGLPEFYFLSFANDMQELEVMKQIDTDGIVLSLLHHMEPRPGGTKWNTLKFHVIQHFYKLIRRPRYVYNYKDVMNGFIHPVMEEENVIPVIIPNWDTTPRRSLGAMILKNAKPEYFKQHVKEALRAIADKPQKKQIIFLKSWNEWGEGNYMEPDLKYGHGYLDALKETIEDLKE